MNEEIRRILTINESGKHYFDAKDVAKFHGVSLNAVYSSRKQANKLDKLMAFEVLKEKMGMGEDEVSLVGDKNGVLNGLDGVLLADKKYQIFFKEV